MSTSLPTPWQELGQHGLTTVSGKPFLHFPSLPSQKGEQRQLEVLGHGSHRQMGLPSSFPSGGLGGAHEPSSSGPCGPSTLSSAALPAQQHRTRPLLLSCCFSSPLTVPGPRVGWPWPLTKAFISAAAVAAGSPLQGAPRKTRDPLLERGGEEGRCEFLSRAATSHPEKRRSICSPVLHPASHTSPIISHRFPSFPPSIHAIPLRSLSAPRRASRAHTLLGLELSQQVSALHGRKRTHP